MFAAFAALTLIPLACGDDGSGDDGADGGSSSTAGPSGSSDGTPSTSGGSSGGPSGSTGGDSSSGGPADSSGGSEDSTGGAAADPYVAGGAFAGLEGYEGTTAGGFALIVRRDDGTDVSVQVGDLDGDTMYAAHVHAQACADGAAGGHYKIDPMIEETVEDNELWPAFTTDDGGNGRVEISSDHLARADAMSVVVHDPNADNAKMLCADLVTSGDSDPFTTTGDALVLQGGIDAGFDSMTADATMERSAGGGTTVVLDVAGLAADETYPVHVHDRDCASGDGGGHYKIDYGVMGAEEANELWLPVTTDAAGAGQSMVMSDHLARAEAQALVVHAPDGTRLACIDLDVS